MLDNFFSQRDEIVHKFDELALKKTYNKKVEKRQELLMEKLAVFGEDESSEE